MDYADKIWSVRDQGDALYHSKVTGYIDELPDGWYATAQDAIDAAGSPDAAQELRIVTRIATEAELVEVLASYGLPGPIGTAEQVRAECQLRIMALVHARDPDHLEIILSNGTREAVRLLRVGPANWTPEQAARANELTAIDTEIERLRAISNTLEADPPADPADDAYWS